MVVISVRDYGVGMTSEQCSRMFDRFWRADPSRARTTGGTGLGMSIVLADTKLHHGDVAVRSRLGEGTWFLVTLPRNPDDVDCGMNNAPIRFATDGDDMRVVGGFGVADNGFVDYLTINPWWRGCDDCEKHSSCDCRGLISGIAGMLHDASGRMLEHIGTS